MQIEYKIKFEDGGVTITQTVEPSHKAGVGRGSGASPGRQLGSTLIETQHLDRLAGGPNEQAGGLGGSPNEQAGGVGGRATISHGRHAAGGSGKVSAVIFGPIVISGL